MDTIYLKQCCNTVNTHSLKHFFDFWGMIFLYWTEIRDLLLRPPLINLTYKISRVLWGQNL